MATRPEPADKPSSLFYRVLTAVAFAAVAAMLFLPAGAHPPGF